LSWRRRWESRGLPFEPYLIGFAAVASLLVLYILTPIIALFATFDPHVFSEVWLENNPLSHMALNALIVTLEASVTSSLILLALSLPLAYISSRVRFRGESLIEALIDVPLMIPHTVVGIMILLSYGGLAGIEDSFWGIVAAMMFVSTPLMVDTLRLGYDRVPVSLEHVARSLGATGWKTYRSITLPLVFPNIITGFILAWARAMSEVGSILIVAYYPKTINVLIYEWFNMYGLKYAASLSILLVLLSLASFAALRVLYRK
jgi:molybdate/tungstate transport system permease protein